MTGKPNRVLRSEVLDVIVATGRSTGGQPVPIQWVQDAIDELVRRGETVITKQTVGYRSAFIGAALLTLSGASLVRTASPVVKLSKG